MTVDIHKVITGNPITKNLMKPWGSNKKKTIFNKYTGPGNDLQKQLKFNSKTGEIYQILDQPSSSNDRCSMYHDVKYTVAENIGKNNKDIKNRKLKADKEWLDCFKPRSPWDIAAYSAIKSKKVLGLGNDFTMEDLSEELNKPVINKFERKKIIVNYIDEIHSCDLVDMIKYSRVNRGYKYIFTNIDIFSKYACSFPIKSKKIQDIKPCFQKIFKERKPKYIWSDQESSFFSKEMLKFFEDNNVKIYHTHSNLKAVVIERFNRSLRELMMKEFVKNNNTVYYNILPELIKKYNNRYHRTIKMKPIDVNKTNEKHIKNTVYTTGEYIIEKVLKTKKNKIYVKWRNYDSSFNSWVNKYDIKEYL